MLLGKPRGGARKKPQCLKDILKGGVTRAIKLEFLWLCTHMLPPGGQCPLEYLS